ncbi:MAG: SDR family NAD(P)-dependent oxidoreductase [Sphingomonadaceae bacterium]|nr:SDR family NAD(P)-dependent oxidoreductase [Sphingomonadaceae bacterium]
MGRLAGKIAVVTGAGRGIGRGIALTYAREGAKVLVASRTPSTVDEVVSVIAGEGGEAEGFACDVGHHDQIEAMIARAVDTWGTIDILVNNAQGFGTEAKPTGTPDLIDLEVFPEDEWEYTMRTGPTATLRAMKGVFPYMKGRGGKIINFGSRRGRTPAPGRCWRGARSAFSCRSGWRVCQSSCLIRSGRHGLPPAP